MKYPIRTLTFLILLSLLLASCGRNSPVPEPEASLETQAVISTSPANGATDVTSNAPVQITFDQAMDRASVESAFSLFPGTYNPSSNPSTWNKLLLTSMCDGTWRVRNENAFPLSFTWDIYGQGVKGVGIAPASSDVFFYTPKGSNTVRLFVNGKQQQLKATNPNPCEAAPSAFSWSDDGKTVTYKPIGGLANGPYTVVVGTSARTAANESVFSKPLNFSFEVTSTPPAPPIVVGTNDAEVIGTTSKFKIVSVLQDINGDLIGEATKENFAVKNFSVAKASAPGTPVSTGTANVSEVEVNEGGDEPLSLILDFDESGSMSSNDRQRLRVEAGKRLVDLLMDEDRAAVLGFTTNTRVIQDFTTDKNELKEAIDQVNASGGTYIFRSLQKALEMLKNAPTSKRAIVLLTDGETSDGSLFASVVQEANNQNVPIYPIGLGTNLNFSQLRSLADQTKGVFGEASKAEDLERVFQAVGLTVIEGSIRIAIDATLDTPLPQPGDYIITADLVTTVRQETFTTPVSFRVKVTQVSVPAPSVSNVSPTKASTAGGTVVTVTGQNLAGTTGVTFGGVPATNVKVNSNTQLTVTTPAAKAGAVNLVVTTPGGAVTVSPFTFVATPNIASLSPAEGTTKGGTTVKITGTSLAEATRVTFGGAQASFKVDSPTQITVTSPAGSPGAADVTVATPYGSSSALPFSYIAPPPPSIASISPVEGPTVGGTSVIVTGENLNEVTSVKFGGTSASFTVNSSEQLTAVSPPGQKGTAEIRVVSPDGESAPATFTYRENQPPVIERFETSSGRVDVGSEVVLSWAVTDAEGAALTCTIDFGDGSAPVRVDNCSGTDTRSYRYLDRGDFSARLTVTDGIDSIFETVSLTVGGDEEQISVSSAEAQAAWSLISNTPELALHKLKLNLSEATVSRSSSNGITIIVPESNRYGYVVAGVSNSKVVAILRYAFDFNQDRMYVTNILDSRSVTVDNVSQLRHDDLDRLASMFQELYLHPAFDVQPVGSNSVRALQSSRSSTALSVQSGCGSVNCQGALEDYRVKADKYAEMTANQAYGLITFLGISPLDPTDPEAVFCAAAEVIGVGVWAAAVVAQGCDIKGVVDTLRWIGASQAAITAYNAVFDCARTNRPTFDAGTEVIAITSPPLPFSHQVFVQSVPEKLNLASGYLDPRSASEQDKRNLLNSAVPNAEFMWESYSGTRVVPESTQIDTALLTISTSYATHLPAPLCME